MTTTETPQTSIYETTLDNQALADALEERQTAKTAKGDATKVFKSKDAVCKELIEKADLGDAAPVRCGRFVITARQIEGGHRSFEVAPSTRLQISLLDAE